MPVKRWDIIKFAKLTELIFAELKIPLVLCGTNHDKMIATEFKRLLKNVETIDIIGHTTTMEFIEVIRNADLVITNDTSSYHIAIATSTSVGMICGGYTFSRYANYTYEKQGFSDPYLIQYTMPCYDCNNNCIYNNYETYPCIDLITLENAWEIVKLMLEQIKPGCRQNEY